MTARTVTVLVTAHSSNDKMLQLSIRLQSECNGSNAYANCIRFKLCITITIAREYKLTIVSYFHEI
jgi:hypothetical protein